MSRGDGLRVIDAAPDSRRKEQQHAEKDLDAGDKGTKSGTNDAAG
jgi:hypothetical protein